MADEKKPVDGIEDGAEPQASKTSETESASVPVDETSENGGAGDTLPGANVGDTPDIHSAGEASLIDDDARSEDAAAPEEAPADDGSTIDATSPSAVDGTVPADPPSPEPAAAAAPAPQVIEKTVVEKKGGFVPMLLGGVIAAAIGYGAATYQAGGFDTAVNPFEDETRTTLGEQKERIDALAAEIRTATDTANGIDLSSLESAVTDLQAQIDSATGSYSELSGRLDAFTARLDDIEKRPLEQISPEAVAAFERELDTLRDAVAQQKTQVEDMTQQALDAEANAEQLAARSKARAALAEAMSALNAGDPYADALQIIEANGVTAPDALTATAADGAPTLRELAEEYPPLAREALVIARRDETEGASGTARFSTFLENQLGVRSVTPRDGDGADAVLSRAEAALKGGDLPTALQELETLPDEAKAPLADWMDRAQTRADAVAAADTLAQELNKE